MVILNISCVSYNKVRYFTDIDEISEPASNPLENKRIAPYDNLFVKVLSTDEQTARILNFSEGAASGTPSSIIGYPVDEKGNINFPFVGDINVAGLTTEEAASKIGTSLEGYIRNSSIIVRFVDNKISVLGEVERQGSYNFSQEKINIYEALALGGGLTEYGDRRNVVLIRQEGNKITHYKINLSDSKVASKDYYYILPNDVIVVEPMKAITKRYTSIDFQTVLTTITAFATLYLLSRQQ